MADYQDNTITYVELPAASINDLNASKAFLTEVFGWAYTDWGPDYADTSGSGLGSGINADPDQFTAAPLVVIYAADLDARRAMVARAGGVITRDIFAFPGGRRFHFREPGGNELAVWSDH